MLLGKELEEREMTQNVGKIMVKGAHGVRTDEEGKRQKRQQQHDQSRKK